MNHPPNHNYSFNPLKANPHLQTKKKLFDNSLSFNTNLLQTPNLPFFPFCDCCLCVKDKSPGVQFWVVLILVQDHTLILLVPHQNDQVKHTIHISGIDPHDRNPVSMLMKWSFILGIVSFGHPPDLVKSEQENFTLV